jgi:flagellin
MSFTISNNSAAAASNYYLGKNQNALQTSIKRLASGKKIIRPSDDPGGLSVAMKLKASVSRLTGSRNNVQNGMSFLEVQDGVLDGVGKVITRMSELKGLGSQDPMKSSQDIESYNLEFRDLQRQLYDMSQMTFNGVSLFANSSTDGSAESVFKNDNTSFNLSIHTSAQGSSGSKISIHKAALLAAITMTNDANQTAAAFTTADFKTTTGTATNTSIISFAAASSGDVWDLDAVSMGVYQKAIENIAYLRAHVGGQMSRLSFAADTLSVQQTNVRAALGRIEDVDIAEESSNLSKYSILTQAAASMLTQANSTNDVALMLLR